MATIPAEGGSAAGPTVLRMMLGAQLRRLRESRGVTREGAGWEIRASESKISRMELGRVGFKERDIADLLTLYGITDPQEREALLRLARDANSPGWWHQYGDVLPSWFQAYLGLEAAAALIRTYELQFVPGLLQTQEYARAVVLLGHGRALPAEIDRRVALRMRRQQVLHRKDPPQLWAVVDEAALRRPIGGPAVMRQQVTALIDATRLPNVGSRSCRSLRAGTPPPAAPSRSCVSVTRNCPTWSTSNSSPALSTLTNGRIWSSTR